MFTDRADAGRRLARLVAAGPDAVVLGLPRGGVPVAAHVARAIDAPLDVIVVRKLGTPGQAELAMGAIGEEGARIVNAGVMRSGGVSTDKLAAVEARERSELSKRVMLFRGDREPLPLTGKTAIVVDDGVATGATAAAACHVARARGAAHVIFAAPIIAADAARALRTVADEVIFVTAPERMSSVGQWYEDFSEVSDNEVRKVLARVAEETRTQPDAARPGFDQEVVVAVGALRLPGHLTIPPGARAVVVFAHGSGSSRHSPRNVYVAEVLRDAGLGTLLFDLLTPDEERDRANVFDIALLGDRLSRAVGWLRAQPWGGAVGVGLFGASTGAAAALWAAADDDTIAAIVSRGGRPDLAGDRLRRVRTPTLLIVGGLDATVLGLNESARAQLAGPSELVVIPGATHLFPEPGTLEAAAARARDWFVSAFAVGATRGV